MAWSRNIEIESIERDNIQESWEFLIKNVTKEDVDKMSDVIRGNFPGMKDEEMVLGFAINQIVAGFSGGGTSEALIRIEHDLSKFLGYTYKTQLQKLEEEGYPNTIPTLLK